MSQLFISCALFTFYICLKHDINLAFGFIPLGFLFVKEIIVEIKKMKKIKQFKTKYKSLF